MRLILVIVGSAFCALVAGCDGVTLVKGQVVDSAGKPVADATVRLAGQGSSTTAATNSSGRFSIGLTHAPSRSASFNFEVSKKGFDAHKEQVSGATSYEDPIVLEPAKK